MSRHWSRSQYYIISKGRVVEEPEYLSGVSPHVSPVDPSDMSSSASSEVASSEPSAHHRSRPRRRQPIGKFDLMFGLESVMAKDDPDTKDALVRLGTLMNKETNPAKAQAGESTLPSGYTYLGQFIAHEITFDKTKAPREEDDPMPGNYRSPQIDLDSLYGLGPEKERRLYQDGARLKVGETIGTVTVPRTFQNDLPRRGYGRRHPTKAIIADPRNDDNLATAQLHVALARFHNKVVDTLQTGEGFRKACPEHPEGCPSNKLFECARREVVQHFQAIILTDFLPRILDEKGMECVKSGDLCYYKIKDKREMFMPLEFSAAAFRFGHSMVRGSYEWNYFKCSDTDSRDGAPMLEQLFQFTHFSGNLGHAPRLKSDWIIDWRRFYDFEVLEGYPLDDRKRNRARKIDTAFNLHLDKINGHPHSGFARGQRSITVRNLLRGYSLDLPTGEQVAERIDARCLKPEEVAEGPHKDLLSDPIFCGKTPLWYYVLREAEFNNQGENPGKLGPVGSCIVAETLVGLIKNSRYSIFNKPDWQPRFGDRAKNEDFKRYEMVDLLDFADVVDPIGELVT